MCTPNGRCWGPVDAALRGPCGSRRVCSCLPSPACARQGLSIGPTSDTPPDGEAIASMRDTANVSVRYRSIRSKTSIHQSINRSLRGVPLICLVHIQSLRNRINQYSNQSHTQHLSHLIQSIRPPFLPDPINHPAGQDEKGRLVSVLVHIFLSGHPVRTI